MKKFKLKLFCVLIFAGAIIPAEIIAQGFNHSWLIGSELTFDTFTTAPKARILFDLNNADTLGETRKMAFRATQATISDANGNFLFATNGCWIMDASGDTMVNGSGISPGLFTDDWNDPTSGLPMANACIIIPYPGDSTKFVLFHQTSNYNANLRSTELYYSVIDMTLNGGLGAVITNKKNVIVFQDTLSLGLAVCKHANGRDWWIVAERDASNTIYKVLFTPNEVESITTQNVNMPLPLLQQVSEPCFSPDGTKFAYKTGWTNNPAFHDVRIFSFDRCTGMLDSLGYSIRNNEFGFGLAFSPNSQYLYYSSAGSMYQLNTNAPNISATDTMVAVYDGYYYPYPGNHTTFWLMYLAANSKIYVTSGAYVIDFHYINSPDSAGIACDVHQHDLRLPCYSIRGGLNHPNYYLGPVAGSICDSLNLSVPETMHDFHFSISPNPTSGNFKIIYLLPQNKKGTFEIFDISGRKVYSLPLPQWSTLQMIDVNTLPGGIYQCVVSSEGKRVSRKIAVIKE